MRIPWIVSVAALLAVPALGPQAAEAQVSKPLSVETGGDAVLLDAGALENGRLPPGVAVRVRQNYTVTVPVLTYCFRPVNVWYGAVTGGVDAAAAVAPRVESRRAYNPELAGVPVAFPHAVRLANFSTVATITPDADAPAFATLFVDLRAHAQVFASYDCQLGDSLVDAVGHYVVEIAYAPALEADSTGPWEVGGPSPLFIVNHGNGPTRVTFSWGVGGGDPVPSATAVVLESFSTEGLDARVAEVVSLDAAERPDAWDRTIHVRGAHACACVPEARDATVLLAG